MNITVRLTSGETEQFRDFRTNEGDYSELFWAHEWDIDPNDTLVIKRISWRSSDGRKDGSKIVGHYRSHVWETVRET